MLHSVQSTDGLLIVYLAKAIYSPTLEALLVLQPTASVDSQHRAHQPGIRFLCCHSCSKLSQPEQILSVHVAAEDQITPPLSESRACHAIHPLDFCLVFSSSSASSAASLALMCSVLLGEQTYCMPTSAQDQLTLPTPSSQQSSRHTQPRHGLTPGMQGVEDHKAEPAALLCVWPSTERVEGAKRIKQHLGA